MRWPFRRRSRGKHALGAAVTAIPAGPVAVPVEPPVVAPTGPVVEPTPAVEPAPVVEAAPVVETAPVQPLFQAPGPRIGLGFTDGTYTALDPSSEQAAALEELARLLNTRD